MKRTVQKHLRLNTDEARRLELLAQKACLSEATLIRLLIKGYHPKEKPVDRFYDVCKQLSSISNSLNQLTAKAHSLGFIDAQKLDEEVIRWHQFQADIERTFLRPEDDRKRWQ